MDLPGEDVADHQDPLIFHQELTTCSELGRTWQNWVVMPSLRMSITSVEGMQNHGAKFVEMSKYLPNFKTSCNKRSRLARFLPMLRYPNAAPTTSSALNQLLGRRPQVDVAAGEMPRGGNSLHLAKGDRGTLKTKDAGTWVDLGSLSQLIRPIPELLKLEDFQDLSAVLDRMAKAFWGSVSVEATEALAFR